MNEVATTTTQLPDTLEDLTQFVLVNKARLQAYMLKLKTVEKLNVAQAIKDQTLKDSQEIASALLAAEQRIGELLLAIPKASGGVNRYNKEEKAERSAKSKAETISDMGYDRHEASDYQQMAKNPEIVQKVIKDALSNGEIPTKSEVTKSIKFRNQLDYLEEHADQKTMERVRSGEQSINSAYLDLKQREQKKLDLSARASLREAEERHEKFQNSNTVSMGAVLQDGKDKSEIAKGKKNELWNVLKKILFIGASETDFSIINSKTLSGQEVEQTKSDLTRSIAILTKILNSIGR